MKLLIHTDGGSRGNPGPAAVGVVVHAGDRLVAELSTYIGVTTNNVAEYRAVIEAFSFLRSHQTEIESVDFYLDSLLVVQQLNRKFAIKKANLLEFAQKIWKEMVALPYPIRFSHVPREENSDADRLVNEALDKEATRQKSQG